MLDYTTAKMRYKAYLLANTVKQSPYPYGVLIQCYFEKIS